MANSFGRFHWRTGENALAPRLYAQILGKHRREFLQLVDILRLATQCECQFARLLKIAVVNFQSFDRLKTFREHVRHIGVELHPRDENSNADRGERENAQPDERAPLRHDARDRITDLHLLTTNSHEFLSR